MLWQMGGDDRSKDKTVYIDDNNVYIGVEDSNK